MKTLVVGASGATGKHLVRLLLQKGVAVKALVRNKATFLQKLEVINTFGQHPKTRDLLEIVEAEIKKIRVEELAALLEDCDRVASCLGHNLTFKGVFGLPHLLVTGTIKKITAAIKANYPDNISTEKVRLVLMSSSGVRNPDLKEKAPFGQWLVLLLLRVLLPPHRDNEKASEFLRLKLSSSNSAIEWVAVRPDSLVDDDRVSDYENHLSPIRSALFNPGQVSRINVADFISRLLMEDKLWEQWKSQMPLVYNKVK